MLSKKIIGYYRILKEKRVDDLLISAGILGVIVGLLTIPIINQIAVWPVLIGVCMKLYDFTEEIERSIIPYDFNKLLPPPKKRN
ncbi:hypothetical protein [Poseidonibacter lekithochrous]|uniref:hypothetical protein n=1 Tax=Poseidonibacter lekithochrous TaxID=1904463 RepID=UPI0008FCB87A|nr:hypothetical protein [Poseidonibacter lekithochrous]QKJ22863.1 hypothetical protein ALEK_1592 [Poseidonibacter lekithochrous]